MPGGSKTQTTTQTNQPYKQAQPLLNTAMSQGMNLYNSGGLNASANQPMSNQTMYGLKTAQDNANHVIANSGFNSQQNRAMGATLGQIDSGGYNADMRAAMNPMRATARGDFLNREDANFEDILSRTKESAGTDLSQMMAGMGRFAGGAHQGQMVDRLGGIESEARLGQYNMERDRQTDAANSLFGMGNTGMTNVANAGNSLFGMGQVGMGNVNDAISALQGVGSVYDAKAAQQADKPMNDLLTLLGIAQGAGQYGTSQAQTPTQNNTMSNMMGGGLGLASLLFGG